MRILTWNIRQGGGARLPAIAEALARHEADVLVITEYRGGEAGARLRAALALLGYVHLSRAEPPPGRNGVLIAARTPFRDLGPLNTELPEPYKIVEARFPWLGVTGVYMPNLLAKVPYWKTIIACAGARAGGHALVLGDFNTCRAHLDEPGAIDATAHFMDEMEAAGFRDLWRKRNPDGREYSWYSHRGNGFRVDHAFFSRLLCGRAGAVRYSHEERLARISDHSALLIDLAPARRALPPIPAAASIATRPFATVRPGSRTHP